MWRRRGRSPVSRHPCGGLGRLLRVPRRSGGGGRAKPGILLAFKQRWNSHVKNRLGKKAVQSIRASDISSLLTELQGKGLSPVDEARCLRRRLGGSEPRCLGDEPDCRVASSAAGQEEAASGEEQDQARVFAPDEVEALIAATPADYRPLVATLAVHGDAGIRGPWPGLGKHRLRGAGDPRPLPAVAGDETKPAGRVPLKVMGAAGRYVLMPRLAEILKQLQKGSEDGTVVQMRQPTDLVFRTAWAQADQLRQSPAAGHPEGQRSGRPATGRDCRTSPVTISDMLRQRPDSLRAGHLQHQSPARALEGLNHARPLRGRV